MAKSVKLVKKIKSIMNTSQQWYIVKTQTGHCQVLAVDSDRPPPEQETWGPFESQADAVARRVGLIRAGKCQPI